MSTFKDTVKNAQSTADKVLAEKAVTICHALFCDLESESAYTYSVSAGTYEFRCKYGGDEIEYTLTVWVSGKRGVQLLSGTCSIHEVDWLKEKVQSRIVEYLTGEYRPNCAYNYM